MIHFLQLTIEGGLEGGREKFERLIRQLTGLRYPSARRVAANPGDWGIDVFVGEIDGLLMVWQAKYFIEGVDKSQQNQIRESFDQVLKKSKDEGFKLSTWTLCIPVELDPEALKWWTGWRRRTSKKHDVRIELQDAGDLETLLISPDARHIRSEYFPTAQPAATEPLELHELPVGVDFDDMLFVKQLQAANILETESAKLQFFNAEALSREIADKRIPTHLAAHKAERADIASMWEDRYNAESQVPDDGSGLLPNLHPEVMKSIERRHDQASDEHVPFHLVHRKGTMQQIVQDARAGWIRDFRTVADPENE